MEIMKEEWNCQVRFEHVYSHIQEKLDKARKEDNKKLIERIEKWMEKTKWRFGGWEWIADGNEKADRLANEGRTMPKLHILIPEGIDKFTVCLKEAGNERATDSKVADIIKEKSQAKWIGKRAKRIPAYDWCHEKITHSTVEGPEGPISKRFTLKLRNKVLVGCQQGKKNAEAQLRRWNCKQSRAKAEEYSSETCPFCSLNVAEDTTHIIGECPKWTDERTNMRRKIMEVIEKRLGGKIRLTRWWLTSFDRFEGCRSKNLEIRRKWRERGKRDCSLGYFPKSKVETMHRKVLEFTPKRGVDAWKMAVEISREVNGVILQAMQGIYRKRCVEWRMLVKARKERARLEGPGSGPR